jgi:tetratricopeptide (TPR) repeat protein
VVIDDERLQELLSKASSLYNNGEYKGAIEAWQEALSVDPGSQKAREGIRMATLLLGDLDSVSQGPAPEATLPADGAEATAGLPAEEVEAQVDLGTARLKQLLAERNYSEAIDGAQSLLALAPDSPEIQRLLEEAQHAFESAPFIDEHLALARELLTQERFSEAEAECKKVFTLDATHPGAKSLLKDIRDKIQMNLKMAASQLGGMTVKLTMPQAIAAGVKLRSGATTEPPAAPAPKAAAPQPPDVFEEPKQDADAEPSQMESGEAAAAQEDVAARAALEAAFEDPSLGATGPEESPFELSDLGSGGAGAPAPEPQVVEAKTIRPPSSRVVPKGPVPEDIPAPVVEPAEPHGPVTPPPVVSAHGKKTSEPTASAAAKTATTRTTTAQATGSAHAPTPAQAGASKAAPQPAAPQAHSAPGGGVPVSDVAEDAKAAWETELTQLNLKDKERGLLRGTGAKATGSPAQAGDLDLMSLLDSGGMPGFPGSEAEQPAPPAPSVPVAKPQEMPKTHARHHAPVERPATREAPVKAPRLRPPDRPRPMAAPRSGFPVMKFLFYLVLLGGLGAGGWYAYQQPELVLGLWSRVRALVGVGHPSQPDAPPAGAPSGTADAGHPPIPTPIGGTSRQQATGQAGDSATGTAPEPQTSPGAPSPGSASAPAPGEGTAQVAGAVPPPAANRVPAPSGPIKPATPPMSKEEMQRKITGYTADGRRLLAMGKWREARAKFNAVLALDPANMEVKDMADKAQSKIDEDQALQNEFDSIKSAFADKDYENALRLLYRVPRDKGLGDIDRYIRNAWYNWAVVLLKAGNSRDALVKLSEELAVDPDDAQALKLQDVAERYTNRAKDRTYYAFTDSLMLRSFDQK